MSSNHSDEKQRNQPEADQNSSSWLAIVREQVNSLKYGTVEITVHDSRVTQVERSEKLRLDRPK
jgi:hypothetical protein